MTGRTGNETTRRVDAEQGRTDMTETDYGTDREILETAVRWLEQGHAPLLVSVARTWGASPRPVGSLMLMREDGVCRGSVSGGCVEDDLVQRLTAGELPEAFPTRVDYGINAEEASRLGLPCGGRLELLVEKPEAAGALRKLLARMQAGELALRRVCLATGEASLHPASPADEFRYEEDSVQKLFGPGWLLLLIGAGHLSHYVSRLARMLDYRVVICDPREDYDEAPVDGVERLRMMPDEAVQAMVTHPRCAVVALTHDPKLDDMALLEALESCAFYVGAIGSRRNSELRRKRLATLGIPRQSLERLHAPVGLPIGSHSPPEIAVAILAEITAVRNLATAAGEVPVATA
jgi:xanthine dehydrogenase accessory factor